MTDHAGLLAAVDRYFDLMYDSDTSRFDRVFGPTAQLHGFFNGEMRMLTAATYREALESQPSPKSQNAPREQQILLLDFATDDQAMVKIRVRINQAVYVDYLTYHRIDGDWLVTAKGFHGGT